MVKIQCQFHSFLMTDNWLIWRKRQEQNKRSTAGITVLALYWLALTIANLLVSHHYLHSMQPIIVRDFNPDYTGGKKLEPVCEPWLSTTLIFRFLNLQHALRLFLLTPCKQNADLDHTILSQRDNCASASLIWFVAHYGLSWQYDQVGQAAC